MTWGRIWMMCGLVLVSHLCVLGAAGDASQSDCRVENKLVSVQYDRENRVFTITDMAGGRTFVEKGVLDGAGTCQVVEVDGGPFGQGQALVIEDAEGGKYRLAVYSDNPFVFFQKSIHNAGEQPTLVKTLKPVSALLDPGVAQAELKALGTAGLTGPGEHPGSYGFLAVAAPETRAGVVAGWLTHDRGNGVMFSSVQGDKVQVTAQIDYGNLRVPAGADVLSETFVMGFFEDARLGLERFADCIATAHNVELPPIPSGYCTWYSNPHGGASDEKALAELAEFAAKELKPYGFDFIQIDDFWQGKARQSKRELDLRSFDEAYLGKPEGAKDRWWWGPHSDFTTHDPKGPYPNGMGVPAENLKRLGFTPGLWLMPFAWDPLCDPLFEHQDYFVKRKDGSLYYADWSGWCLDMTHPEARAFLADTMARITRDWGFDYLKLDGLWAGLAANILYVNNPYKEDDLGEAVFHNPDKTAVEAYRDGLKLVRDTVGKDVFILGCNVSQNMRTLGASYGLVNAMRIGPDNGPDWGSLIQGPWHGSNRYFLHGRVWHNDPDPIYVRESMPLEHARLVSSWVALSGQLTVCSDWLPELPAERLDILKRVFPNHGLMPRPVDLFEQDRARVWLLTDTSRSVRRDVIGLFNWQEKEGATVEYAADEIGLPKADAYVGFDFWANEFVPVFSDTLRLDIAPGSCRLIAVRPVSDHPMVISTNRHISQGIVDLLDEQWDASTKTLIGRSKIVANDPYELRVVLPEGAETWRVESVETSVNDVTPEVAVEDARARVTLHSPSTGEVAWWIRFRAE